MKLAVLCGGPGPERGISLNSARSVCDHLPENSIEIIPIYFDLAANAHRLDRFNLYSNTPSDFDFKLDKIGKPLSKEELSRTFQEVDMVFPVIHGAFGEDGELQELLENLKVPFVGSPSQSCRKAFDKFVANEVIRQHGYYSPQSLCLDRNNVDYSTELVKAFFSKSARERMIVKPSTGGSSIGVHTAETAEEAIAIAKKLLAGKFYPRVVIEPYCTGKEFTVVIIQNQEGQPVSLMPIEIEADYTNYQIFDFRKKYLPTRQVSYHCPPRFSDAAVATIMKQAEALFTLFGMADFARFDGWLLPDGNIWFSDFNPISGMEQNSFLFVASARVGMTHSDVLSMILSNSARRQDVELPDLSKKASKKRAPVSVLFGGKSAERHVSVMTGTNVWLKLLKSEKFESSPYFLDIDNNVWKIPYAIALNHTAEEILHNCKTASANATKETALRNQVRTSLGQPNFVSQNQFTAEQMPLAKFLKNDSYVFLGLHGDIGENGVIQKMCEDAGRSFNGSPSSVCKICVDKYEFGEFVKNLNDPDIHSEEKLLLANSQISKDPRSVADLWATIGKKLGGGPFVIKPNDDGCSAGVCRLDDEGDLLKYCEYLLNGAERIPAGTLKSQAVAVEMPSAFPSASIVERYIETDKLMVIGNNIQWQKVTGWVEVTIGVFEQAPGDLISLSPSITIASDKILSVEEKFQGGTGVNITPPPEPYVSKACVVKAKQSITKIARNLGIRGYARFDCFLNIESGKLIVIEVNNLPALTPSTVIFHQALAENPPIQPRRFLERIIEASKYS